MPNPKLVAGDTRPIRLTYKNGNTPVNISAFSIDFVIGYTTKLVKSCTIIDDGLGANTGVLDIAWTSGDLIAGSWPAEFIVTDGNGTEKTHKIPTLEILARI